jgi:hypothetical protein
MRVVVGWLLVVTCSVGYAQPRPTPGPRPPIPVVTTPCGTIAGGITLVTTNVTRLEHDLCTTARRALAKLPMMNGRSLQVDVLLARITVDRSRLSCTAAASVQANGTVLSTAQRWAHVTFDTPNDRELAAKDCAELVIEDVIHQNVAKAMAKVRTAPWLPPARRSVQPIPSPVAPAPAPTTFNPTATP